MAFQISPGVQVTEVDLTTIIPAVGTTDGAFVGTFAWGPVDEIVLIDSQSALVRRFGKPDSNNFEHWFSASNFLDYGNKLKVVRVVNTSDASGANNATSAGVTALVKNRSDYDVTTKTTFGEWVAKYPGAVGNALRVSVCDSVPGQYTNTSPGFSANTAAGSNYITFEFGQNRNLEFVKGDVITFSSTADAPEADFGATVDSTGAIHPAANIPSGSYVVVENKDEAKLYLDREIAVTASNLLVSRKWEFADNFDLTPGNSEYAIQRDVTEDEIHIAISDRTGAITGTKGTVLETFSNVSKASDAKNSDGTSNYYVNVINDQSQYIYWANHSTSVTTGEHFTVILPFGSIMIPSSGVSDVDPGTSMAGAAGVAFKNIIGSAFPGAVTKNHLPLSSDISGGTDGNATAPGPFQIGYDIFNNPEEVDISLVICGPHDGVVSRYVIDNIVEDRKDCVAFVSPQSSDCVNVPNLSTALTNVVRFRTTSDGINGRSSSYAVMDSGWKYQYDKFNDVYRWVPLNADIAGLCVNTDNVRDPWFSPAGLNRGQVKNVVKLAWNPRRAQRDALYKNGINPVVNLPGQGTVLFGDKTLQVKPSAFDRINVRRLFIVLEKAIAAAAKYTLFEFNDEFTRAQFRNLVEPFLRDVQGRRGIYDFKVVCDTTNNTPEVIDRNEFIGDIYIKPARSINFITLNFVAARTGVQFDEIVGQF